MTTDVLNVGAAPVAWTRRHMLSLESLSAAEIQLILDLAVSYRAAARDSSQKSTRLRGRTVANLFFENSTRTRASFTLASRRLGADTLDFSPSGSSLSKGETFIDTAR